MSDMFKQLVQELMDTVPLDECPQTDGGFDISCKSEDCVECVRLWAIEQAEKQLGGRAQSVDDERLFIRRCCNER